LESLFFGVVDSKDRVGRHRRVHVRSPDRDLGPDDFRNLKGTSLSSNTSEIRFSWRSDQFFQRHEPNCWFSHISGKTDIYS